MKLRALVIVAAAGAFLAPAAQAGPIVDRAVAGLQNDPVYVDAAAKPTITDAQQAELERRIAASGAGPLYLAILPDSASAEAGGSPDEVLRAIASGVHRRGTYAVVVGRHLRAGATNGVLPQGAAAEDVDDAVAAHKAQGLYPILLDFVARVARDRNGAGSSGGGGGGGGRGGGSGLALLGVLGAALLVFLGIGRARRRRHAEREFAEVGKAAQDDLVALSEDIDKVDIDVQMPQADPHAREDYGQAIEAYKTGSEALDRARRTQDLEQVTSAIGEGRFAMASAQARLEGRPPPERRPPCFFDPRHGPSTRDVRWAPPGGQPRDVPACEADALAVESGQDPESRQVEVGGRMVPYWRAPAYFGPFAGGYFGGFGGFFPGLLFGELLGGGGAFGGGYYGGGDQGGDSGGDFGGGGGDF